MTYIDYFKSQAKKLYKDFQTQYKVDNDDIYFYNPKFWLDLNDIIVYFDIDEDNFSLMKAQHYVAKLANFNSWKDLINANQYLLELGYYLIENRNDNLLDEWQWYESYAQMQNWDDSEKLHIFKQVFLREKINNRVNKLMHLYGSEDIDAATYKQQMVELMTSMQTNIDK